MQMILVDALFEYLDITPYSGFWFTFWQQLGLRLTHGSKKLFQPLRQRMVTQ